MSSSPKILIVDDKPNNLISLEAILQDIDAELICAEDGNSALRKTLKHDFALAILDVQMPGMDGYELAQLIHNRKRTSNLPVIFVSAIYSDDFHVFKGYESGCVDFITKPFDPKIMVNKVRIFTNLFIQKQQLQDANTYIAQQNRRLIDKASRDGLTKLYNHAHFQDLFKREFELARRHARPLTLLMCDLDFFKDINDTHGHQTGDMVLKEFAALLQSLVRDTDIVARYGGEEFILALPHTEIEGGVKVAESIRKTVKRHVFCQDKVGLQLTVSIGISTIQKHHQFPADLIEAADIVLYKAKENGRDQVFSSTDRENLPASLPDNLVFEQMRSQLLSILVKNKATALSAFEALVQSHFSNTTIFKERNEKAIQLFNLLGKRLKLPNEMMHSFRRALKLHDLTRLYIKDSSFNKATPLSSEERQNIKNQPILMKELADHFDLFADERQILLHHHEHYDGTGYPKGLEEEEIPLCSRIFAIVDAVMAILMPTYPREIYSREDLINELQIQSGKQFDPFLVTQIVAILENGEFECIE